MDQRVVGAGGFGDGGDPVAGSRSGPVLSRLGRGAEFDLIRGFYRGARRGGTGGVRIGAGDDCAVVVGESIAISADLSIEGVHFRRTWLSPEEIGYRAAVAALSDLAAMAARPIGILASLAVTPDDAVVIADSLMLGVRRAVEGVGGELLGGDLTRSPGPVILDIVVVGEAASPVLRSGAKAGDEVWVTGTLGGAAAAVRAWGSGAVPESTLRERFAAPTARVREALWLAERTLPRAMIDLSDGLAGDLEHLAAASGVAIVLQSDAVPVHPAAATASKSIEDAFELAIRGGEDYEICFAVRPGSLVPHQADFERSFGVPLTRIGTVEAGAGVFLEGTEGRTPLPPPGFAHFDGPD